MRWLAKIWWSLIRFGFRLLYNELAFTYDLVSRVVSLGQWRCWQRASLKYLNIGPDEYVLELAHGTGNLQVDLHQAGIRSIGLDFSPYMGRIAQRKITQHKFDISLIQATALQLPFESSRFPAIISTFPTPFIFELQTLSEIHRVLKNDGILIIVINGQFNRTGFLQKLLEWLYRITGQRSDSLEMEFFSVVRQRFTEAELTVEFIREPCKNSFAQLIIARK